MMDRQTPFGVRLAELAARAPGRPCVTEGTTTVTRRELEDRSNRLARVFADLGVSAGSLVTVGLPNSVQFVESVVAAWKLGATPQPVSFRLPAAELEAILELADPSLVVGLDTGGSRPNLPQGFTAPDDVSDAPLLPVISPSWKAPTSGGSTGRPKLIVSTTPAVAELVTEQAQLLRGVPDGVHLATGPLYHNGPFAFGLGSLLIGCHLVLMRRFDPLEALALVERERVDWMYAVPTMMSRIWKLPAAQRAGYDLRSLRTVFHMAAPCPPWLKRAWIDWLGAETIWELYGGTEAQSNTIIGGAEWLERPGSVGRPTSGEIRIKGPDGEDLPAGTVGEVFMRPAPGTSTYRYIGAQARALGDWESLGDMGRLDADGYLYLTDRLGDMILVGGANVYPAEVEGALLEHPEVISACVVGRADEDLGSRPHAVVQVAREGSLESEALRGYLLTRLEPHKVPRSFEIVTTPVRDDAGKVRRADFAGGTAVTGRMEAPR
jgi:bile acid-coenzyme A ligase